MANTKKLVGEVESTQIDKWKKDYPQGIVAYVTDDGKIAYFKKPCRIELKMAADAVMDGLSNYNDSIIDSCYLGGEESIIKEGLYYNGLSRFAGELSSGEKGRMVKL